MVALPTWAEKMTPVDMDGAAALLGVSRRFLVDVLRTSPHYERRGIKKVFYPEHIARLKARTRQISFWTCSWLAHVSALMGE